MNNFDEKDTEIGNKEREKRGAVYRRCSHCAEFLQWFEGRTCPRCGQGRMI